MKATSTAIPAGELFDSIPGERTGIRRIAGQMRHFAARKPLGAFGAVVLVLMVLVAMFADALAPYDPLTNDQPAALQGPTNAHLAGTDQYGRDIFSRIIFGSRTSLYIGISTTIVAMAPAIILGLASAHFGGLFDYLLQRFVDAMQAIPGLILLIAIMDIL